MHIDCALCSSMPHLLHDGSCPFLLSGLIVSSSVYRKITLDTGLTIPKCRKKSASRNAEPMSLYGLLVSEVLETSDVWGQHLTTFPFKLQPADSQYPLYHSDLLPFAGRVVPTGPDPYPCRSTHLKVTSMHLLLSSHESSRLHVLGYGDQAFK